MIPTSPQFGGIRPIRIVGNRTEELPILSRKDLHDIMAMAAHALLQGQVTKGRPVPAECPQSAIDAAIKAHEDGRDVNIVRGPEAIEESINSGEPVHGGQDSPSDWFMFVNDEHGRDAAYASAGIKQGQDGADIMMNALKDGRQIQYDKPIIIDLAEFTREPSESSIFAAPVQAIRDVAKDVKLKLMVFFGPDHVECEYEPRLNAPLVTTFKN